MYPFWTRQAQLKEFASKQKQFERRNVLGYARWTMSNTGEHNVGVSWCQAFLSSAAHNCNHH
jgi:hypothetical protein